MTHRMEDWDSFRLVPTLAHALAYVSNWGDVLRHPRNNMGVFHDLQSAYFGLMQFDVWWDEAERKFVQISPEKRADHKDIAAKTWFERRYVISPTGCVNRMLSEMCGAALLHLDLPKDSPLAGLAAERGKEFIIVIANRQGIPADLAVSWPGRPLTDPQVQYVGGDSPCAALPGEYRTGRLKGNVTRGSIHVTAPPFSIVQIKARLSG